MITLFSAIIIIATHVHCYSNCCTELKLFPINLCWVMVDLKIFAHLIPIYVHDSEIFLR